MGSKKHDDGSLASAIMHPMHYKPKDLVYEPLVEWQYAASLWNRAAPAYARGGLDSFAPLHKRVLLKALDLLEQWDGPHVLDVASGPGEPAVSIAQARPDADVISTDFAASNARIGMARAARAGVDVIFQFADMEDLQFDDDAYDLVTCSLGLMYVVRGDALAEMFRVCKPEGFVLLVVHGPGDYHVPFTAVVDKMLGDSLPVPECMGTRPLSLGTFGVLTQELEAHGFEEVTCEEIKYGVHVTAGSDDEAWEQVKSPLVDSLVTLREQGAFDKNRDVEAEAKTLYMAALKEHGGLDRDGFSFPDNSAFVYVARKPSFHKRRSWFA